MSKKNRENNTVFMSPTVFIFIQGEVLIRLWYLYLFHFSLLFILLGLRNIVIIDTIIIEIIHIKYHGPISIVYLFLAHLVYSLKKNMGLNSYEYIELTYTASDN